MPNLSEGVDGALKYAYRVFDEYCGMNNIPFSIDCDTPNVQGYLVPRIKNIQKINALKDYMKEVIARDGGKVELTINPQVTTGRHTEQMRKDGTLFQFSVKPIQEHDVMAETACADCAKLNGGHICPKCKRAQSKFVKAEDKFDEKLSKSLNEHVEITFAEPEVLLTHQPMSGQVPSTQDAVKQAINLESQRLQQYAGMLESTEDENLAEVLEEMTETSSSHIRKLEALLSPTQDAQSQPNPIKN